MTSDPDPDLPPDPFDDQPPGGYAIVSALHVDQAGPYGAALPSSEGRFECPVTQAQIGDKLGGGRWRVAFLDARGKGSGTRRITTSGPVRDWTIPRSVPAAVQASHGPSAGPPSPSQLASVPPTPAPAAPSDPLVVDLGARLGRMEEALTALVQSQAHRPPAPDMTERVIGAALERLLQPTPAPSAVSTMTDGLAELAKAAELLGYRRDGDDWKAKVAEAAADAIPEVTDAMRARAGASGHRIKQIRGLTSEQSMDVGTAIRRLKAERNGSTKNGPEGTAILLAELLPPEVAGRLRGMPAQERPGAIVQLAKLLDGETADWLKTETGAAYLAAFLRELERPQLVAADDVDEPDGDEDDDDEDDEDDDAEGLDGVDDDAPAEATG